MPFTVTSNDELKIIEVVAQGHMSKEELYTSQAEIAELSKQTGMTNILVDTRQEQELPSLLALDDFGASLPGQLKFALLVSESQPTNSRVNFVRNVAMIEGVDIEVFTSKEACLTWLSQEPS